MKINLQSIQSCAILILHKTMVELVRCIFCFSAGAICCKILKEIIY